MLVPSVNYNGWDSEAEEDNWTVAETVSRTARMDSDGRVCFRVKGGKGVSQPKSHHPSWAIFMLC